MEIGFRSNRVRKLCERSQGKLKRRLDDILAADNLKVLRTLPGRCHALRGNRSGQWAIDLDHPQRLIFEPLADPLPVSSEGWLDLEKVTAIRIIEIVDYHD